MKAKLITSTSVAILALCASANAATISFNAVGGLSGGMAASDTAGVVSAANWNNMLAEVVSGAVFSGSLGTVKDDSGTTLTSTTVAWSGSGQTNGGGGSGTNDTRMFVTEWDLFNAGANSSPANSVTITVANVPYANYDVYFYVQDGANEADRGGNVDANGTLESIMMFNFPSGSTGVVPPTSTSYVEADNKFTYSSSSTRGTYLRLENITGSTLTLGITAKNASTPRLRMSGFQIVEVVPEPSAALLTFLGSSLLIFSRRRS